MIVPYLPGLVLAAQLIVPVADDMPRFDVRPSCHGAASLTPASMDSCLRDEQSARDSLAAQWSQFATADRRRCVEENSAGGAASYVELLTCLQMARDARSLPRNFQ